jgi:predicted permease
VKRPLFSAIVVLTLGSGIGVNSAIFSLVNAALFGSLGVHAPSELLNVYTTDSTGHGFGGNSYADYVYLRDESRVFNGVLGYSGLMTTVTGDGSPEVLFGELVTGNYFAVSGAPIALGRGFLPEEDRTAGTHPVVVIGHRLWQRRFGGDPGVIGRRITLNGHPYTIVGVAGAAFNGLLFRGISAELWAPAMMMGQLRTDQLANRDERWMFVKGRLAPGVTLDRARAELATSGAQLATAYPASNHGRSFAALRTTDVLVNPEGDRYVIPAAALLVLAVAFVLLIACTNLANMMLARATARRREIAVRLALGASRGRLVRQLMSESALLAVLGGALGLLVAYWLTKLLVAFRPPIPIPISLDVGIDFGVAAFTGLLSIFACVVFGLVPALHAARASVTAELTGHGVGVERRGRFRLRDVFLVPQLALSLVLLVVAGLFVRSIAKAGAVQPGFDIDHTAMIALNLALDGYTEAKARSFYEELSRRLRATSGVRGVTITDRIPLDLYGNQSTTISVVGATAGQSSAPTVVQYAGADASYFDALGVRMVRGRAFTEDEARVRAPVAIVSEHTARRLWPGADPIGQHVREGAAAEMVAIVGVAADVKVQTLGEAPPAFLYRPFDPRYARLLRLIARTSDGSGALVAALRREVAAIDPQIAVFESKTMTEHLEVMLFPYRAAAQLSSALGLFGLLLASVGLYGVVAFGVARRTREFGVRMALGARGADILRLVLGESMRLVVVSVAIGVVLAVLIAQLLSGIVFGIGTHDPLTLLGVPAVLACVTLLASYLPTRRATRVSPAIALRDE